MTGGDDPLRLVHHHPGRIRVRARRFVERDEPAASVAKALGEVAGVRAVAHARRTGSLVIEYDPLAIEADALLGQIVERAGLDGVVEEGSGRRDPRALGNAVMDSAERLNGVVAELLGGAADLRLLVPLAMAGVSAYSAVAHKDERLPRWDNLLWWSYSVFTDLHRRATERQSAGMAAK